MRTDGLAAEERRDSTKAFGCVREQMHHFPASTLSSRREGSGLATSARPAKCFRGACGASADGSGSQPR
jgi:hypothetical protein